MTMTSTLSSRKRPRRRRSAAAEATVVLVAAAVMAASVLMLHGSNHLTIEYESASYYLPSFVNSNTSATLYAAIASTTNETNKQAADPMTNETTKPTGNTTCFSLNSQSWLKGPRLGNAPLESDQAALDLILNSNVHSTLEQTLCHKDSQFLDWNDIMKNTTSSLNLAALRLIYLAFYIHQHEPAWKEARHRQAHCSVEDLQTHDIHNMDYECPDTQFLVVPLGPAGLGAVMRLTVVNALLAGMATRRIVLFINNASTGPSNIQEPWPHASCDRHDMQCFFLPSSPCVLTHAELADAHVLERSEMRSMFRNGQISGPHAHDRVVVTKIHTRPHMAPPHLRENLVAIVQKHVIGLNHQDDAATASLLWHRAAELFYDIEPLEESRYYYFGHSSKVHHGAVFYAMRPRLEKVKLLNDIVTSSLASSRDFDPDRSIGLPIRGSDKCLVESECLSFQQHVQAVTSVWKRHKHADNKTANIILTTEDERVMNDMKQYTSNSTSFRFITNKRDVMQGTGVARDFDNNNKNVTADDVMLSSVAALQLQLLGKYAVGNCCSNFHNLLFDFVREGCGAARDAVAVCLQELEDPEFRVCCSWDKSEECTAKRLATEQNKTVL